MHSLDIFSDSPKYFIFQKETNKTNFGGVLTLFFSLFMIFISILYYLDYLDLDNYSIEYSHILINSIKENNPKLNNISELNPNLTFVIELGNNLNKPLSERFILYDYTTKEVLDRKKNYTIINRRVSDFYIGVNYSCSNEPNCSRKEEDISEDGYFLVISIILPDIDLQNNHLHSKKVQ